MRVFSIAEATARLAKRICVAASTGSSARAQQVAAQMSGALLAFARTGDPNHAGLPGWERYSLPRRQTLLFADDSQQTDDPRGGERRLYQQAPFIQRGTF